MEQRKYATYRAPTLTLSAHPFLPAAGSCFPGREASASASASLPLAIYSPPLHLLLGPALCLALRSSSRSRFCSVFPEPPEVSRSASFHLEVGWHSLSRAHVCLTEELQNRFRVCRVLASEESPAVLPAGRVPSHCSEQLRSLGRPLPAFEEGVLSRLGPVRAAVPAMVVWCGADAVEVGSDLGMVQLQLEEAGSYPLGGPFYGMEMPPLRCLEVRMRTPGAFGLEPLPFLQVPLLCDPSP